MERHELAAALESRGLRTTMVGARCLRVYRPGAPSQLAETVTFWDGRPHWSWGKAIEAPDIETAAVLLDRVVSPPSVVRTSG